MLVCAVVLLCVCVCVYVFVYVCVRVLFSVRVIVLLRICVCVYVSVHWLAERTCLYSCSPPEGVPSFFNFTTRTVSPFSY